MGQLVLETLRRISAIRSPRLIAALLAALCALSLDAGAGAGARQSPLAGLQARSSSIDGSVAERLSAGSYTYLRILDDAGVSRWIVTVGRGLPVGGRAHVASFGARDDFHSARLRRTFEHLEFGWVTPALVTP